MWQCVHVILESSSGQHGCWLHSHETESNNEFSTTTCNAWCAKKHQCQGWSLLGWLGIYTTMVSGEICLSSLFPSNGDKFWDVSRWEKCERRLIQRKRTENTNYTNDDMNIIQYILGGFTMFSWKWQKKHSSKSLMVPSMKLCKSLPYHQISPDLKDWNLRWPKVATSMVNLCHTSTTPRIPQGLFAPHSQTLDIPATQLPRSFGIWWMAIQTQRSIVMSAVWDHRWRYKIRISGTPTGNKQRYPRKRTCALSCWSELSHEAWHGAGKLTNATSCVGTSH